MDQRAFDKADVTYSFDTLPSGQDASDIVGGINRAIQAWAAVTPLHFSPLPSDADFRFRFDGKITQPDGTSKAIPSYAVARTDYRQISFDGGRTFTSTSPPAAGSLDVVSTAAHELGHLLGLEHSLNRESVMYPSVGARTLSADDIERIQRLYGAPAIGVPGWFGKDTSGVDVALADFQDPSLSNPPPPRLDMVVAHIDDPGGPNQAYYRVGWDVDPDGLPRAGWSPILPLGAPLGLDSQGLGLAVGHLDGSTTGKDLIMVWVDDPGGENNVRYRIARNLDRAGMNGTWGPDVLIPGPWGDETAGLAAALADVSGSGSPDLIVAWIDNPDGENHIYYKVGFDLDANGVAAQWSPRLSAAYPIGYESAGLGIAATDLRGNGRPDVIVFWVDDPQGDNIGVLRVGLDLDPSGMAIGGWWTIARGGGWWGERTRGAGAALADLRGLLRPDLVVLHVDAPSDGNRAYTRVLSPWIPTWNVVRTHLASAAPIRRVAALSAGNDTVVVATRSAVAPAPGNTAATATTLVWDATGFNQDAGNDVLEFLEPKPPVPDAHAESPIALASRDYTRADAFWIGEDRNLRTSFTSSLANPPPPPLTAPVWSASFALQNSAPARDSSAGVPLSPLAAASLDDKHVSVFFVGDEDGIRWHSWTPPGWGSVQRINGFWKRPIRALSAVSRGASPIAHPARLHLFWVDGVGAVWELTLDTTQAVSAPTKVVADGSVGTGANLVAVSRDSEHVDLFWIAPPDPVGGLSGPILTASWDSAAASKWSAPIEVASGHRARMPGAVAAVHAGGNRLQVFWEEPSGSIWSSWWDTHSDGTVVPWSPPAQAVPDGSTSGGLEMAAASRLPGNVRLFFVDAAGKLAETFWGATP